MLAPEVRAELRSLSRQHADRVALHLVAAGQLLDSEPQRALQHAREARRMAARIGAVREAVGIAAYHASEWAEALTELRAARRLTGDLAHLPLMADCERAMGRPERALRIAQSPEAALLGRAGRVELAMVEAGARRDMGEIDAALMILRGAGLDRSRLLPWSIRLWYAYADTLLAAGHPDQAAEWFIAVAGVDNEDQTDAEDRLVDLGVLEPVEDPDSEPEPDPAPGAPEGSGRGDPDGDVDGDRAKVMLDPPGSDDVGAHDPGRQGNPVALTEAGELDPAPPATAGQAGGTPDFHEVVPGYAIFREPETIAEPPTLPQPTDNLAD